jgi:hypothetical protein
VSSDVVLVHEDSMKEVLLGVVARAEGKKVLVIKNSKEA